jgi:hypothetical protein
LGDLLGDRIAAAATFHSVCAGMLRADAAVFGRTENYTIDYQADTRHSASGCVDSAARREEQREQALERSARMLGRPNVGQMAALTSCGGTRPPAASGGSRCDALVSPRDRSAVPVALCLRRPTRPPRA